MATERLKREAPQLDAATVPPPDSVLQMVPLTLLPESAVLSQQLKKLKRESTKPQDSSSAIKSSTTGVSPVQQIASTGSEQLMPASSPDDVDQTISILEQIYSNDWASGIRSLYPVPDDMTGKLRQNVDLSLPDPSILASRVSKDSELEDMLKTANALSTSFQYIESRLNWGPFGSEHMQGLLKDLPRRLKELYNSGSPARALLWLIEVQIRIEQYYLLASGGAGNLCIGQ